MAKTKAPKTTEPLPMKCWRVWREVIVSKQLATVEAATEEEAINKAAEQDEGGSLCHYCTRRVGDEGDVDYKAEAE